MLYLLFLLCGAGAWFISTLAAGGGAMLLIPLIGLILGPQVVAPTVTIASVLANPSRAFIFWPHIDWQIVRWLVPGSFCGAALGAYTFTQMSPIWVQLLLGIFLLSTLIQYRLGKARRSFPMPLPLFFVVGTVVAFLSGLIGGTGPVQNPFFLNYGVEKEQLVATKAINSLFMQGTKLTTYISLGAVSWHIGVYGLIIGVGGIIGVYFARRHLLHINTQRFRNYTLTLMPICGLLLIIEALMQV